MDGESHAHVVASATAAATKHTPQIHKREQRRQGSTSNPLTVGSLHAAADGRPSKRPYPQAFPQETDFINQSPRERRHTFLHLSPGEAARYPSVVGGSNSGGSTGGGGGIGGFTPAPAAAAATTVSNVAAAVAATGHHHPASIITSDPPVPIHQHQSPGAGAAQPPLPPPPGSYPSLPYTSPLSTGFGPTPELAGYNLHSSFDGISGHVSPLGGPSYEHTSMNNFHHHHPPPPQNPHLRFFPPYNTGPSATVGAAGPPLAQHIQSSTATVNHGHVNTGGSTSMTHHDIPPGPSPDASFATTSGVAHLHQQHQQHQQQQQQDQQHQQPQQPQGYQNSQTHHSSSTTIVHQEQRSEFVQPPQYYGGYMPTESPFDMHPAAAQLAAVATNHDPTVNHHQQQQQHHHDPHQHDQQQQHNAVPAVESLDGQWEVVRTSGESSPENDMVIDLEGDDDEQVSRAPRRKFKETELASTNETRKMKACVRCRMQRIRCQYDPDRRDGACLTCQAVSTKSKKVIHRLPCLRYKLTETILYREGGLQLTKRWESNSLQLHNVGDWASTEIRTIEMTLGICEDPIRLEVRKFVPRDGDVLHRNWVDGQVKKSKRLEPYALADIGATAAEYQEYIKKNAIGVMMKGVKNSEPLIRDTYQMAVRHFEMLDDKDENNNINPEKEFLAALFRFVFAVRHTEGSSWLCGEDTLDMEPETKDPSYPLFNKVSTPRMIIAQFDSLNALKVLQPTRNKLMARLEEWVSSNRPRFWFTIYLTYFILLHEVALSCEDRYRHAYANSAGIRYTVPNFVSELQHGANVMLAHWQYYKKDLDPLNMDIRCREKTPLNFLTAEQLAFVMQSFKEAAKLAPTFEWLWENNFWEHPSYFLSQMFEKSWEPRKIWSINGVQIRT